MWKGNEKGIKTLPKSQLNAKEGSYGGNEDQNSYNTYRKQQNVK